MTYKNYLKQGKVTIFSKSYCPFCVKIKDFFTQMDIPFTSYEYDLKQIPDSVISDMQKDTNFYTFPSIFIGEAHVKGYTDVMKLVKSNQIASIFEKENIKYQ